MIGKIKASEVHGTFGSSEPSEPSEPKKMIVMFWLT
jgi:hypothetical protein